MSDDAVPSDLWTNVQADTYDNPDDPMFAPALLDATTAFLAEAADGGAALEFAIGTGRVAIPLAARGVPVQGLEYSEAMAAKLREKSPDLPVTMGDMSSTRVDGDFSLVYLVYNTIGNLWTQDAQVSCFRNAARHLTPGGRFVVEVGVPSLRSLPPGALGVPFDISDNHVGFDTYDLVSQRAVSHHFVRQAGGSFRSVPHHYRYVWPSELDLMAQLAGLTLEARYADWSRAPFTTESTSHVSVWRRPA
ncbi:class I SAM-dependent DNA methyltransferase [Frondihabitans australicus]|uniref:Ubiquinone/menaquinone biosynthesis C-methylase UbiE n=1 Tax=Frondihabitans australicus TaxID=386892 RepID=A0A495ICP1_9MICO|nr:class I SAM-dependent methyltransferase [Frondihabitans australicus]RKR73400.1 ubiquinone/menaquinone biosynthesis C-methylase UbiE [Frondihabitans australicus]